MDQLPHFIAAPYLEVVLARHWAGGSGAWFATLIVEERDTVRIVPEIRALHSQWVPQ